MNTRDLEREAAEERPRTSFLHQLSRLLTLMASVGAVDAVPGVYAQYPDRRADRGRDGRVAGAGEGSFGVPQRESADGRRRRAALPRSVREI